MDQHIDKQADKSCALISLFKWAGQEAVLIQVTCEEWVLDLVAQESPMESQITGAECYSKNVSDSWKAVRLVL